MKMDIEIELPPNQMKKWFICNAKIIMKIKAECSALNYGELDDENTDGDHNKILINKKARTSLYMNGGNIVITRFHERQSTKF